MDQRNSITLIILLAAGILLFGPKTALSNSQLAELKDGTYKYRYGHFDIHLDLAQGHKTTYYSDRTDNEPKVVSPEGDIPGAYSEYDTFLTQASYLAAGDLESDGFADLVSSSYYDGYIAILHQLTTTHQLELVALWDVTDGGATNGVRDVYIRDMNDDGRNDIVVFDVLNELIVIFVQTDEFGVFLRTQVETGITYSRGGVDDLNNDGLADLLWTEGFYAYASFQIPDSGGFTTKQTFTADMAPTRFLDQPVAGDVNGDGLSDLVAVDGYARNLMIWKTPDWQFSSLYAPNNVPKNVALGDFDHDNIQDMAVPGGGTNQVVVTWGDAFTTTALTAVGNMYDVAIGDLDNDDALELVATDKQSYHLAIWNFVERNATLHVIQANVIPGQIIVADLNGDGLMDVAYGIAGYTAPPHAPITVHYQMRKMYLPLVIR